MLTVGEVAHRLGVNPQTLYFYERKGIITPPQRNSSGYRVYQDQDLAILEFVCCAKKLGFSLEEIADILRLKDQHTLTCKEVYHTLAQKILQLNWKIEQMEQMRNDLCDILQSCCQRISNGRKDQECCLLSEYVDHLSQVNQN